MRFAPALPIPSNEDIARRRLLLRRIMALLILGIIVGHAAMMTSPLGDHQNEIVGDVMPVRAMAVSMALHADDPISMSNAPGELPGHHPDACGVLLQAAPPSPQVALTLPSFPGVLCASPLRAGSAVPTTDSSEPGQPPQQRRAQIQIWRV